MISEAIRSRDRRLPPRPNFRKAPCRDWPATAARLDARSNFSPQCTLWVYAKEMEVPITQFRREIFALANRALEGETITIAYKGKHLRVTAAPLKIDPATRFDRVTRIEFVHPEFQNREEVDMLPEMQREWEKDWEEQGLL
jgi:hypothetical protein